MKGLSRNTLLLGVLIMLHSTSWSQTNDAGLWTSISLEKNWTKKIQTEVDFESRYIQNISLLETAFIDVGTRYEFSDFFRAAGTYRFGTDVTDDYEYRLRQRLTLDLYALWEIGKLDMDYRTRFQFNRRETFEREGGQLYNRSWRHKFSADHKLLKKVRMDESFELFLSEEDRGFILSDFRITLALKYKINKRQDLKLGYLFQSQLQDTDPLREFVLQIGYSIELD